MRRLGWCAFVALVGMGLWGNGLAGATMTSPHAVVTSWSQQSTPLRDSLNDVACTGSSFCAAVGSLDQTPGIDSGVAVWNGASWSASVDPAASLDRPSLRQVACVSSGLCMAVGQYQIDSTWSSATLIEEWNGTGWSVLPSPDGALADSELDAVSCTSASFCLAVGESTEPGAPAGQALTASWNGAVWSLLALPPGVGAAADLVSVSCVTASYCLSLGGVPSADITGVAAAQLLWDGGSWSVSDVSGSPPPIGVLSCPAVTFCMAASDNTFMEWNGDSWSSLPVASSSEDDEINAITCSSSTFCVAVGSRDGRETGYVTQTLVKEWNGTVWSYVPSADATTTANDQLSGVSCADALCTAVGYSVNPDNGLESGLIESSVLSNGTPTSTTGPVSAPIVGAAPTPDGQGYWLVGSDGAVYPYGDAVSYGSMRGGHLNAPIVGMATTPDGGGYWLVGSDGGIFAFGDATFYGSTGSLHLNAPIVGMTASPDGQGYWFVASDGGIFAFGDATFYGSMGGTHLNRPVVGMAVDDFSGGYWLVAADGGIFAFHAPFFGSTGALQLNKPIVGMEADPGGQGYRFVASDGGVFSFNLPFSGSTGADHLNQPVVGMAAAGSAGYWLVARDGGLFSFGGAPFEGSPA